MKLVRAYLSSVLAQLSQASAYMTVWFGAKSYTVLSGEERKHNEGGRKAHIMLITLRHRRAAAKYDRSHVWEHAVRAQQ